MRKIFAVLIAIFTASPAFAGNLCGGGVICIEQNTVFNHANAAVPPTTFTIFTCNSTANGCLVPAVMIYGNMSGAVNDAIVIAIVQGGISNFVVSSLPQPFTSLNALVNDANAPPAPLSNAPVDGNGNPVLFLSAGASLTATNTVGITASGIQSGTMNIMVYAQQF